MLVTTKEIKITGKSMVNGVQVQGYTATIDSEDPSNIRFTRFDTNKDLYAESSEIRDACREDLKIFEETAYEYQKQLIAETEATAKETTEE